MREPVIPFSKLLAECNGNYIAYQRLLNTNEWFERRKSILKRDINLCQQCGKGSTIGIDWLPSDHPYKESQFWEDEIIFFDGHTEKNYIPPATFGDTPFFLTIPISDNGVIVAFQGLIHAPKAYHLEIHHRYYLRSSLPWQYRDDALITLCNWCHRKVHSDGTPIPVYQSQVSRDVELQKFSNYTVCTRCNGTGRLPQYDHVEKGVCFLCNSSGYIELKQMKVK
ncbi:hypothetical protein [Hymenobacter terricola]|uniref:hypothetical protein n=1 Tax=Hymenobacter terricola TaxID=2819236 RepID=UPI001B313A4B|nr:hypothetical protein [Hymenobacter terricola]